jgi:hypothetical protein
VSWRKRIRQLLGYFRRNPRRMAYAEAKSQHLPIGAGVSKLTGCWGATAKQRSGGGPRYATHGVTAEARHPITHKFKKPNKISYVSYMSYR